MKLTSKILCTCFVLLLSLITQAASDLSIYRAYGSVKNQSDAERNIAASLHLGEIIVRVSGRRDALLNPIIQQSTAKASSYLFSFSYTGNRTETIDGKPQVRSGIQLDYSPHAINQLLRDAQLPLWPSPRPEILVWSVYQDVNGLQRVLNDDVLQQIKRQAYLRGVSIKFPELDLEDDLALSTQDLWNLNFEKINAASVRYKPDLVAVVRYQPKTMGSLPQPQLNNSFSDSINEPSTTTSITSDSAVNSSLPASPGPWVIEWHLAHASQPVSQQDEVDSLPSAFATFVHSIADDLSNRYSIRLGQVSVNNCYVHIGQINNFSAMKKSQAYLQSLAMVQKAEVVTVNRDGLLIALTIEGDARLLASTFLLGQRLIPEFDNTVSAQPLSVMDETTSADTATQDGDNPIADTPITTTPTAFAITPEPELTCTQTEPLRYLWQQ